MASDAVAPCLTSPVLVIGAMPDDNAAMSLQGRPRRLRGGLEGRMASTPAPCATNQKHQHHQPSTLCN
jgi:hypothetical protein